MKAKEYLLNALNKGITKPVYFRGFNNQCWESKEMTITQAIELLDTDFSDIANYDIQLSQSGVDADFPNYMVVYFLD
jgi:hypothetical protein